MIRNTISFHFTSLCLDAMLPYCTQLLSHIKDRNMSNKKCDSCKNMCVYLFPCSTSSEDKGVFGLRLPAHWSEPCDRLRGTFYQADKMRWREKVMTHLQQRLFTLQAIGYKECRICGSATERRTAARQLVLHCSSQDSSEDLRYSVFI